MGWAGLAVQVAGLALQARGGTEAQQAAAEAAAMKKRAAEFEATQLEQAAGQSEAVAQLHAAATERAGKYTQSRALALAAASGGGASDPTVMKVISGLAGETAYRKALDLYTGEEKARQLRMGAEAARLTGEIGAEASRAQGRAAAIGATSSILSSAGSLYTKYGYRNPVSETDSTEPVRVGYD